MPEKPWTGWSSNGTATPLTGAVPNSCPEGSLSGRNVRAGNRAQPVSAGRAGAGASAAEDSAANDTDARAPENRMAEAMAAAVERFTARTVSPLFNGLDHAHGSGSAREPAGAGAPHRHPGSPTKHGNAARPLLDLVNVWTGNDEAQFRSVSQASLARRTSLAGDDDETVDCHRGSRDDDRSTSVRG